MFKRLYFWLHTLSFPKYYKCNHCCLFCEYFDDYSRAYFGK